MIICQPLRNTPNIISLGVGCAIRTELIRKYFPEQPTLFFDYLANYNGLDTCTRCILNDFQDFQDINDFFFYPHPKWNTDRELKPISLCVNPPGTTHKVLVNRHFVDLAFFHYKHSTETLHSFKRKSERLQKMLLDTQQQAIFVYYRQYDEPIDDMYAEEHDYSIHKKLARLESEALQFKEAIEEKYPALQFKLLALIMEPFTYHETVTPAIDKWLQQRSTTTGKIIFDRVLSSAPEDKRKISSKSWGRIYRRHLIPNPVQRLGKACLTIPFKMRRHVQQLRKRMGHSKEQP